MPAITPDACGACRVQIPGAASTCPYGSWGFLSAAQFEVKIVRSISGACFGGNLEEKVSRGLFIIDPRDERGTAQRYGMQHAAQIRRKMRSAQPVHDGA